MLKPGVFVTSGRLLPQAAWPAQPPPLPKRGTGTTTGAVAASSEPRMSADRTAPASSQALSRAVEVPGEVLTICSSSSRRCPIAFVAVHRGGGVVTCSASWQVEAQVAKLSEVLDLVLPGASAAICRAPPLQQLPNQGESDEGCLYETEAEDDPGSNATLAGFWLSLCPSAAEELASSCPCESTRGEETEGLDSLLEALEVRPCMVTCPELSRASNCK